MTLRLQLANRRFATLVSVYEPTLNSSDDVKDRFYHTLNSTLRRISKNDKIILLGDFNARVCKDHDIWHCVIGNHGAGNMTSSGLRLLSLCSELGLAITNTFFQLVTCTRLFGCIPGPKTGTTSSTSMSGAVICMKFKLHEPCVGRSVPLITA